MNFVAFCGPFLAVFLAWATRVWLRLRAGQRQNGLRHPGFCRAAIHFLMKKKEDEKVGEKLLVGYKEFNKPGGKI